jgi:hypothetical protein
VQKVPKILDEVHWLHEAHGLQFALCGSSARKVKRGAARWCHPSQSGAARWCHPSQSRIVAGGCRDLPVTTIDASEKLRSSRSSDTSFKKLRTASRICQFAG